MSRWFPGSDSGASLEVAAFTEEGAAPSIPGPLVRVPLGTPVAVSVINDLTDTLFISGLKDPVKWDSLVVPPGARGTSTFTADRAGMFVYQGGTRRARRGPGDQLSGVIVVDSVGAAPSRLFVIGSWNGAPIAPVKDSTFVMTINGRTWPWTERLHFRMSDTARWQIVSVSPATHPMHLHGGFFHVEGGGDWRGDRLLPADEQYLAATENTPLLGTFTMTWSPTHPGRWLFHCHVAFHVEPEQHDDLARRPRGAQHVHANLTEHLNTGMAGLILGIDVEGDATPKTVTARRQLGVDLVSKPGVYANGPGIGFALPGDSLVIPGPPLLLTRGEPVAITVRNRLAEPASVHWHGIELESYYDGVAGWSGDATRPAPLIAPGDSFVVRFTPPRAGTFIYHSHVAETRNLASGMYGGLVVLEPGARWDPTRDHLLIFSQWGVITPGFDAPIVLNAKRDPPFGPLTAGVAHRLRLINIAAGDMVSLELLQGDSVITARRLAKDGADLPPNQANVVPARFQLGEGETMDIEIKPTRGDLKIAVKSYINFESHVVVK
ncbi:MAG TPA: multicopper oxidase domain-containing protein [Gemmatimonadales bacterium]|nr:multicopper oxidase domain-containing protein [Gemmatimonadales bacterium]